MTDITQAGGVDANQAAERLAKLAAMDEPLQRRFNVPRLSIDDPDFGEKFKLASIVDDTIQQACELLRADIAPDLRAVLTDRDTAVRQRDYAVDANRVLIDSAKRADRRAEVAQFVLDQCRARIATLESELTALTEPTEYGRPGVQWSVDHHGTVDGRPSGDVVPMGEKRARETVASWRAAGLLPDPVLLCREFTAWRRWPLDEAEAERMSADGARFSATEPSRHDSPQCAPAGGGCACQGGGS